MEENNRFVENIVIRHRKELENIDLKKENEELKHQLEEKDKENQILRKTLNNLKGDKASDTLINAVNAVYEPLLQNAWTNAENKLRHQVCEEIRERAFRYCIGLNFYNYLISPAILDQIERGETK